MTEQITRQDTTTWVVPVYREDADEWVTDLTGAEAQYLITTEEGSGQEILEKTTQDGGIVIEDAANVDSSELDQEGVPDGARVLVIELTPTDTETLETRRYYHEVEIQFNDGSEKTVVGPSPLQVNPSAT